MKNYEGSFFTENRASGEVKRPVPMRRLSYIQVRARRYAQQRQRDDETLFINRSQMIAIKRKFDEVEKRGEGVEEEAVS